MAIRKTRNRNTSQYQPRQERNNGTFSFSIVRFTVYGLQFTVYSLRFTVYGLRFTVYARPAERRSDGVYSCYAVPIPIGIVYPSATLRLLGVSARNKTCETRLLASFPALRRFLSRGERGEDAEHAENQKLFSSRGKNRCQ
jgi:hypothetical protein